MQEERRGTILGDMLYPHVAAANPALAGKITRMLVEMPDDELLELLMPQDPLAGAIPS